MGNSSPFDAWTVMMRTASSSASGTGTSTAPAPSSACRSIQSRKPRQRAAARFDVGPCLVGDPTEPPPALAGPGPAEGGLDDLPLPHQRLDEGVGPGPRPPAVVVEQRGEGINHRPRVVAGAEVVEAAPGVGELQQLDVAASEDGGAERRGDRHMVGGAVDGPKTVEDLPHGPAWRAPASGSPRGRRCGRLRGRTRWPAGWPALASGCRRPAAAPGGGRRRPCPGPLSRTCHDRSISEMSPAIAACLRLTDPVGGGEGRSETMDAERRVGLGRRPPPPPGLRTLPGPGRSCTAGRRGWPTG